MPDIEVKDTQTAAPAQEAAQSAAPVPPRPPMKKSGGKGKKKVIQRIIALAVVAAIIGGAGYGMWYLVFREDKGTGKPLTDVAGINTIQSVVQGYGNAVPKESAAITLNAAGTVLDLLEAAVFFRGAGDEAHSLGIDCIFLHIV